jgi:two-component system, chemotaxis family, sensor kinase Cph1
MSAESTKMLNETPARSHYESGTYRTARAHSEYVVMGLHDLGEPLAALRIALHSFGRVLGGHPVESREHELLRQLTTTVDRMGQLVNNLVEVAHAEQTPVLPGKVDLVAIAHEVCTTLFPYHTPDSPLISLNAPRALLGEWNELRVWQILSNLVCNAARHGHGSLIEVCIWAEDGYAWASVEDAGPGIDERMRDRIFERGWRGNTRVDGHGLGLWIAKQFSQELGGDLLLCSKRGPGAKFIAKLPLPGVY